MANGGLSVRNHFEVLGFASLDVRIGWILRSSSKFNGCLTLYPRLLEYVSNVGWCPSRVQYSCWLMKMPVFPMAQTNFLFLRQHINMRLIFKQVHFNQASKEGAYHQSGCDRKMKVADTCAPEWDILQHGSLGS